MEREDATRTGRGIAFVAEESLDTGGFVEERERARANGLDEVRQVHRVMSGLLGDARQESAFLLGLNDADPFAIDEQEIVAGAGFQRHFAQRDAASRGRIELFVVLNDPPARNELRVNLPAGKFFRFGQRCTPRYVLPCKNRYQLPVFLPHLGTPGPSPGAEVCSVVRRGIRRFQATTYALWLPRILRNRHTGDHCLNSRCEALGTRHEGETVN